MYAMNTKQKHSLKVGIILDKCLFRQSFIIIVPFQLSHYHWYGSPGEKCHKNQRRYIYVGRTTYLHKRLYNVPGLKCKIKFMQENAAGGYNSN